MRRDPIKSAARTLEILELFHERRAPLRLTYIFERLSYPQSSTTTLLKSMVVLGYLNYDRRTRTYFPTPRVAALGDWINHHLFAAGDVDTLMKTVFEATNETVVISSQNDIYIQHIRVLQPTHAYKAPPAEGSMRVLCHSAAGLVLMSRMTAKAVDKLCRHINALEPDHAKKVDIESLAEQLQWIRREGYGMLAGFPISAAAGIAMPMPRAPHGIQLTLGVGGLNGRIVGNRSEIIAVMRAAIDTYGASLSTTDAEPAPAHAPPAAPHLTIVPPSVLSAVRD